MRSFGEEMGIAFQIKDDLLDFAPSAVRPESRPEET